MTDQSPHVDNKAQELPKTLPFRLRPKLEETGSYEELEGLLPLDRLYRGSQLFELDGGITYKLNLTNTGGGVLLRGKAQAAGTSECARCLEEASFEVEGDVEGYYILDPSEEDLQQADDEITAVAPDGVIDLWAPITAAIIFELPQVLLCKEDCAGLCPVCGTNLNVGSCDCAKKPNPDHPFAALQGFIVEN